MLNLESPRKPKNIIHRISDQQKPEQKSQKEGPQPPTSPPKSSGTGNKEEKNSQFPQFNENSSTINDSSR